MKVILPRTIVIFVRDVANFLIAHGKKLNELPRSIINSEIPVEVIKIRSEVSESLVGLNSGNLN